MDSQEGLHPAFAVHFWFSLSQNEAAARGLNLLWSLQKLSPPAALTASINVNSAISWISAPAGCNAFLPAIAFSLAPPFPRHRVCCRQEMKFSRQVSKFIEKPPRICPPTNQFEE
ncbi:MAG: hypothetical protein ACPIOQ_42660, partial [Promethearchaeia archaeon]